MITKEVLELISKKLGLIIMDLVLIGLLFFILAVAVMFYPQVLQVLFVIGFFVIAFLAFSIGLRINHIKSSFDKVLLLFPKNKIRK